jgi:predicted RND superfamily exporter protein
MLQAYARWITQHAVAVLVGCGLVSLVAVAQIVDLREQALRLRIDTSIEQMLPTGDASRAFYDHVRKLFGNDETLLLVVHRPAGIFETELLGSVVRLSKEIEHVSGIDSVLSLSTAPYVEGAQDELLIQPLFEEPPRDPETLATIRAKASTNPLFVGTLVNENADTTALVIQLLDISEGEFTRLATTEILWGWLVDLLELQPPPLKERGIDQQIQALAARELGPDVQTWLVGSAHIKAETTRMLIDDLMLVIPLAILLIAVIAWVMFRTLRGMLIPLTAVGVAVLWTLAVMVTVDPWLNLVTVSVPMLLLVIGFAYSVHVVACYYHAIEEAEGEGSAARRGLYAVLLPTLLTFVTTVAGFLSLVTHPLAAIRQFGLYGGIGVLFCGITAITYVPAILQLLREPGRRGEREGETGHHKTTFDRLLERLGRFDYRNATAIFVGVAALGVFAALGVPRISVNSTMVSNFPSDSPVRIAVAAVNRHLGGAGQVNVVLETDYPKGFTEPSILKQVEELQAWLAEQPAVAGSTSILDYIKLIHRGFNGNRPEEYKIPATRNLVAQLLFFGASDETKRFVDTQYQTANVLVRTTALDSADLGNVVRAIEERLAELKPPLTGQVTGNLVLISKTNDEIAVGQAISVTIAFAVIFVIMSLVFTSVRMGFIAMIPNIFPVLLYFGVLGWTGITLNVTTGLVASIVLGIAVDDTVHFLSNFNRFAREKADELLGVQATLVHVGRPVITTTVALTLGFGILALSQLRQQAEFGLLAAGTVLLAGVADLVFNPALTSRVKIVTLWDVLTLDLGENPHEAIPVFHGLSSWQARIVALMTEIVSLDKGERLIQSGQKSDGMYVVVEGELQSSVEREGVSVPLNRHSRGDVLGEVGLFRGERTANVDCESPVRALHFNQENLARLQRRYPRTASTLLRNLSEVLADRLASATARVR